MAAHLPMFVCSWIASWSTITAKWSGRGRVATMGVSGAWRYFSMQWAKADRLGWESPSTNLRNVKVASVRAMLSEQWRKWMDVSFCVLQHGHRWMAVGSLTVAHWDFRSPRGRWSWTNLMCAGRCLRGRVFMNRPKDWKSTIFHTVLDQSCFSCWYAFMYPELMWCRMFASFRFPLNRCDSIWTDIFVVGMWSVSRMGFAFFRWRNCVARWSALPFSFVSGCSEAYGVPSSWWLLIHSALMGRPNSL